MKKAGAIFFIWIGLMLFPLLALASRSGEVAEVSPGIEEKLGQQIPQDVEFRDEEGRVVRLGDLLDKPTLLTLVYYSCPGICSPLLNGVVEAVSGLDMQPGVDYQIITVSFNSDEGPELAREKKRNYLHGLPDFPPDQWYWLTGDSANIARLTRAVGFHFQRQENDFAHPAAVVALSQEGKICRYLYGITFLPFDFKMAILEASEGKTAPSVAKVLKFCFSYDPQGRKYVFNFLRVVGVLIIISSLSFVAIITYLSKKPVKER